jgi:hypothetical protein
MLLFLGVIAIIILITIIFTYLPERIAPTKRNKILAHIFLFVCDVGSLWLLWYGYHDIKDIVVGIQTQADTIRVFSRAGFYTAGLFVILGHIYVIAISMWPVIEEKHKEKSELCAVTLIIVFFVLGFGGSAFMKSQVVNAGYTYCREASGLSALARTLVYTKDAATCEKQVELKRAKR